MFYQLPPAGERIVLKRNPLTSRRAEGLFNPFSARFYNSGTEALAAALKAAIASSGLAAPEVVLPAYGCPDLVSAVLHARGRPRFVDLAPDRPWMDLTLLRSAIGVNTAAVVAVDLFGIPERYGEIKKLLIGRSIPLVQDSAQALPTPQSGQWQGDYVILSFGRGKPVSLLGGGAVLFRDAALGAALTRMPASPPSTPWNVFMFRLKVLAYNALISPYLYWLPANLPFLRLGETRYKPLDSVTSADQIVEEFIPENVGKYWRRSDGIQSRLTTLIADGGSGQLLDLLNACSASGHVPRLLRYPVLAVEPSLRERLYQALSRKGLGVSRMYPLPLPAVRGLENILHTGDESYPNAKAFSQRILTLPVHGQVSEADLRSMHTCMRAVIAR